MSRIRNRDTKPEELVRKYLFSQGFRYRKNDARLPGKPDIVLPKYKTAIFVNGCFWHKHEGCKYFVWPKNNAEFWKEKIEKNAARDTRDYRLLQQNGWRVITIWECELKPQIREQTFSWLCQKLKKNIECDELKEETQDEVTIATQNDEDSQSRSGGKKP